VQPIPIDVQPIPRPVLPLKPVSVLPTSQPISPPVSSRQPPPTSKPVENQAVQSNSLTQPTTADLPTQKTSPDLVAPTLAPLPPIDDVASWPAEGSFKPVINSSIRQTAGILPANGPQNSLFKASVIPSEVPQSERLVHALPPMNPNADSALLAPIAEIQSVDTMRSAETEPAANLKTQESTGALVPVTTGLGGLLNRFQSK